MTPSKINKAKEKFLKSKEKQLNRKVSILERKLMRSIVDKVLDKLETDKGIINSTGSNTQIAKEIEKVFRDFNNSDHIKVVLQFANDLQRINGFNTKYFDSLDFKTTSAIKKANIIMRRQIGITKDNKIVRGSYLDNFLKDTSIKNEVVRAVNNAIANRSNLTALKTDLKNTITTSEENGNGRLQRYYKQFAYDTYQSYDRTHSTIVANDLGLQAFIYSGNKIRTTRPFCKARAGKVFLIEEAMKWKNLQFQGKTSPYNPLSDLGGYNCRHGIRYISNSEALRRRKDLKIDENGKLVKI